MMRPMKLAGDQLLFGENTLEHLASLKANKAVIVMQSDIMYQTGVMDIVEKHLKTANINYSTYVGFETDPKFSTVLKGARFMLDEGPDLIIAIGGGSSMDAAKAMWIYYENPEIQTLDYLMDKKNFPKLRKKARLVCIPTTAGTASEVSRSIVITDDETNKKYGIGNMEMMPDVAICDPVTTLSLPKSITAQTGMDALCHALEAIVSTRSNHLSDMLSEKAILDIFKYLPKVMKHPKNIEFREKMLTASMVAGLAFTNVSLGITHSIAHSLGSLFSLPHGLANAILLPYIVKFNYHNDEAKVIYDELAKKIGKEDMVEALLWLNEEIGIPKNLKTQIPDEKEFLNKFDTLIKYSLEDGCTKTNPIFPSKPHIEMLAKAAYYGNMEDVKL